MYNIPIAVKKYISSKRSVREIKMYFLNMIFRKQLFFSTKISQCCFYNYAFIHKIHRCWYIISFSMTSQHIMN